MSEVGPDQSEDIKNAQRRHSYSERRPTLAELEDRHNRPRVVDGPFTPEQDKKMREIMMEDLGLKDRFMIFVDRARNALRRRSSAKQTETQAPPTQQPPSTPTK